MGQKTDNGGWTTSKYGLTCNIRTIETYTCLSCAYITEWKGSRGSQKTRSGRFVSAGRSLESSTEIQTRVRVGCRSSVEWGSASCVTTWGYTHLSTTRVTRVRCGLRCASAATTDRCVSAGLLFRALFFHLIEILIQTNFFAISYFLQQILNRIISFMEVVGFHPSMLKSFPYIFWTIINKI